MSCKSCLKWALIFVITFSFIKANAAEYGHLIAAKAVDVLIAKDTNVAIIDIRRLDEYHLGHYQGSVNIWRSDYVDTTYAYGGIMPSRGQFAAILSGLGIESQDKILLYDGKGGCEAARFWWILKTYGHPNAYIVDGGFEALVASGSEMVTQQTDVIVSNYEFLHQENRNFYASLRDVKNALEDENTILLDTRTVDEFVGEMQKKGAFRSGRIPRSIHNDWTRSVHIKEGGFLKSIKDLKYDFAKIIPDKDKKIIVYCQSGVRSAHTTFVLSDILGYTNVKNYDGSWIEWSYYNDLPIELGNVVGNPIMSEVNYLEVFVGSFGSYASYVWSEITFQSKPWYQNYFWLLILLSVVVWLLEFAFPWRKNQPKIRADFWIDAFYMFFNFFIFNLIIFVAFRNLTSQVFSDFLGGNLSDLAVINIQNYPEWAQLLIFFIATDFVQWFTHVLLHRFDFLWRFHKVHHSVEEMGFAAHLRYHWMENVFYTPMKYIMVMLIGGFHPEQAFIVYYVAIAIGHLNHANIALDYGPFKYVLNNPKMHIWHHAYELPENHKNGANFGISLSVWDYVFKTNYLPRSGRDIRLGFEKIEQFPKTFIKQLTSGFSAEK